MRHLSILAILLTVTAMGAGAAPAGEPEKAINISGPGTSLGDEGALEMIQPVAKGVWVIRQRQPFHLQPSGNVTVIEQSKGLVLIDGGGSSGAARRIAERIRSVSQKPVT